MTIPKIQSSFAPTSQLLMHSYLPDVLQGAVELEIFDILATTPMSCSQLAEQIPADAHLLESLLDVLEACAWVERKEQVYALPTASHEFLVSSAPAHQLAEIRNFATKQSPFKALAAIVRNKERAFDPTMWANDQSADYLEQHAKGGTMQQVLAFTKSLPGFDRARWLCDYAGNTGYMAQAFLDTYPGLQAHVYDLPEVCQMAIKRLNGQYGEDKLGFCPVGKERIPKMQQKYDIIYVSHFLYEFSLGRELNDVMQRIFEALNPGGWFVSCHVTPPQAQQDNWRIPLALVELMTRMMGYPTHRLPRAVVENAATAAGFQEMRGQSVDYQTSYPLLLFGAQKSV